MDQVEYKIGDEVVFIGTESLCTIIALPGSYKAYPNEYGLRHPDGIGEGIYDKKDFRKLTKLEKALR